MKHPEPLEDWERELHRQLMALPELDAPSTLIPGVLNRIKAPARLVWYRSSWWHWPIALRTASVVLTLGLLGALGWFSGSVGELGLGQRLAQTYAGLESALGSVWDASTTLLGSSAVFWNDYGQMILIAAAALLLATYLTCVAAGTALYQLAWRRAS